MVAATAEKCMVVDILKNYIHYRRVYNYNTFRTFYLITVNHNVNLSRFCEKNYMRTVQMKQILENAWYESRWQHMCIPGGVENGIHHVCAVVVLESWHVVALPNISCRLCNITRAR